MILPVATISAIIEIYLMTIEYSQSEVNLHRFATDYLDGTCFTKQMQIRLSSLTFVN